MGSSQSTAFQTSLEKFAKKLFFLERKQWLERTFLECFRRLLVHYRANKAKYAKTWQSALETSLDLIYNKRAQVEELLALLKSESRLQKLNKNELFKLVMEKCHSDPTFSSSCWDNNTSDWSEEKVETFFRKFSDLLEKIFLDLFDNTVLRPDLLDLGMFHSKFPRAYEIDGNFEYNARYQKSVLFVIVEEAIEYVMADYHYSRDPKRDSPNYLTASNGVRVKVRNFFVRTLDQFWVDLLLILGSNAESNHNSHEFLLNLYSINS
jgi:hypothetical protein